MSTPTIRRLSIERFRRIRKLTWYPGKGVNIILGGGDVGKTSILDAIGLLFSPVNPAALSDAEFLDRNVDAGFTIEAVVSLPPETGISEQAGLSWPWEWDGTDAVAPKMDEESSEASEPVYRLRVRGTEDLELVYEIIQPDESTNALPVALRRSIGLVRLGGDDRNDRDLRLVYGSALDRLLSDKGLRARLASDLAGKRVKDDLTEEAQKALEGLDTAFTERGLPDGLDLAVTGSPGLSAAALIGLTAKKGDVQLPLANWGAGTRRIASLAIAKQKQGEGPITLIDEIERGLEPYRQRSMVDELQSGPSQVFVTTHSPFVVSAASLASIWYVDGTGSIGKLDEKKIGAHQKNDPETFLACLSVIPEGAAEKGFVTALLEKAIGALLKQYGIHVSDGGGQETTLGLLEALADGGMQFGGFADDENGKHPERWKKVSEKLGPLLFRWEKGCLEENVIAVAGDDQLEALMTDPEDEKTGMRFRTLAERLNCQDEKLDFEAAKEKAGENLRKVMTEAAQGAVPEDKQSAEKSDIRRLKAHGQNWFKTEDGGQELANKVFSLGLWPKLKPQLLPFCNAVRHAVGLSEIQDIAP